MPDQSPADKFRERRLSSADLQQILLGEITALIEQSAHYEAAGDHEKVARLQAQAALVDRLRIA